MHIRESAMSRPRLHAHLRVYCCIFQMSPTVFSGPRSADANVPHVSFKLDPTTSTMATSDSNLNSHNGKLCRQH